MTLTRKFIAVGCLFVSVVLIARDCQAQRYEEVDESSAHKELRRLAAKFVHNDGHKISEQPEFRFCNEGHYHVKFPSSCQGVGDVAGLIFNTRLEIETAWKYMQENTSEAHQASWTPYLREIDAELASLDRRGRGLDIQKTFEETQSTRSRIEIIWKKGAEHYANAVNRELKLPDDASHSACAAAGVLKNLTFVVSDEKPGDVINIQWETAGECINKIHAANGGTPSLRTIPHGGHVEVILGVLIIYRYQRKNGEWTDLMPSDVAPDNGSNTLVLPKIFAKVSK